MSLAELSRPRLRRAAKWGSVGAVGMCIDLIITLSLLSATHPVAANAAGWAVAVSFNFSGNYVWTYRWPDGSLPRQYASYVSLHGAGLAVRAGAVAMLVGTGTGPVVATLVGVAVASLLNFLGTETILDGSGKLWFDAVEASNHLAHVVYSSRLRDILHRTGLYDPIFRLYTRGLRVAYPVAERRISVNGASATVQTDSGIETVSVLHTLENEHDILHEFVGHVGESDRVLDVGANLGVFSALAGDIAESVTAVEPHPPTADACRATFDDNGITGSVVGAALGDDSGTVQLAVDQDQAGTQRPEIAADGDYSVRLCEGDSLGINPSVIKVDVEGAEEAALRGLTDTLADCRVCLVECHDDSADACADILSNAGLCVRRQEQAGQTYLWGER